MTYQKGDKLKNLLQRAGLNKPGPSFTEEVMKEVQSEVVVNPLLKSMLTNVAIEEPGENFTYSVMDQLEVSDFKLADQSIINKKVWLMVSGLVALLVLVAVSGRQDNPSAPSYFNELGNLLHPILKYMSAIPVISVSCLISVSGLSLLDYFLKERFLSPEK